MVVVDTATGAVAPGAPTGEEAYLQLSLVDGRKLEGEGDREDALDACVLLVNKAGQPLLAHGRSGSYTDDKRVCVPMIHGQVGGRWWWWGWFGGVWGGCGGFGARV